MHKLVLARVYCAHVQSTYLLPVLVWVHVCVQLGVWERSHAQWPHLLSCLPAAEQQWNQRAETELCAHLSQRLQMEGGSFYSSHPPQCDYSAQRVCGLCALPHLGPPALPDLSNSDILLAALHESSITSSHTAVSRKDFNIMLLSPESFVLFRLLIYGGNRVCRWLIYTERYSLWCHFLLSHWLRRQSISKEDQMRATWLTACTAYVWHFQDRACNLYVRCF